MGAVGAIQHAIRTFRTGALDLVYPPGCAACDEPVEAGACFCELCAVTLIPVERACRRCALPIEQRGPCPACRLLGPAFDEASSAFAFGGAVADALRLLKFSARVDLGPRLGALLSRRVAALLERLPRAIVVPVPLARRRLAARGFNQAALLALGAAPALVRTDALMRTRDTPAQVGRSAAQRRLALAGAFAADERKVAGRPIILVDDVMTTGATLDACTRALNAAGASYVAALTVGRALP